MDFSEIQDIVYSVFNNDDPHKEYKQLKINKWYSAFSDLFTVLEAKRKLPFVSFSLGVLLDEECWENTDSIHGIKLNRRIVAKKMLKSHNCRCDISNPLDLYERYQVACWCCLEEEIVALFQDFKQVYKIKDGDTAALKKLVKFLSGCIGIDHIMEYWSHVVSGYAWELKLEGQHLYAYALNLPRPTYRLRVETVEFFWDRIKSLPECELSAQQKDEIFMKITVYASADCNRRDPGVFEFCFSQTNPDKYPELLKRDLAENGFYASLITLKDALCFDEFQRLFDCLKPCEMTEDVYSFLLGSIKIEDYLGRYVQAESRLFMHMWMKEGFDTHRVSILNNEMKVYPSLLNYFVRKNCMEPVWAILDKASPDEFEAFMGSFQADYIRSTLKERKDKNILNKFLSYSGSKIQELEDPSASLMEVDFSEAHEAKRPRRK